MHLVSPAVAALIIANCLVAVAARAADVIPQCPEGFDRWNPNPDAPCRYRSSYASEVLANDVLFGGVASAASITEPRATWGVGGYIGYGLGAPLVHFGHGDVVEGFVSLALHSGATAGGVWLASRSELWGRVGTPALLAAATVIDALWLSRPWTTSGLYAVQARVRPTFAIGDLGATIGAVGHF